MWKNKLIDDQMKTIHRLNQKEMERIEYEYKLMDIILEKDREILQLKSLLETYKNGVVYG